MPVGWLKKVRKSLSVKNSVSAILIPLFVGDSFSTGDVLLEIETDKAQMDVEAQDDGKMAKIIVGQPRENSRHKSNNFRTTATRWCQGHQSGYSDSCYC